jgi:glutamate-1-semialdehyde 2,1-aminomutase
MAAAARAAKALVIFDEVISGFRVAFGGMAQLTGITPDLVTYGKVIGGGFPVGAYGGRADLMDWVAPVGPVYQAGTLSANPVAMAAGLTMLKKLKGDNPYPILAQRTERIAQELEKIASKHGFESQVQRFSSMFWTVYGKVDTADSMVRNQAQIPATQKERYTKVFHELLNRGFYTAPSGFEVSFISTAHTDAQFERLFIAFDEALGA